MEGRKRKEWKEKRNGRKKGRKKGGKEGRKEAKKEERRGGSKEIRIEAADREKKKIFAIYAKKLTCG